MEGIMSNGRIAWLGIALIVSIASTACGKDNPIGPSNQPEINNAADSFQFQVSNLDRTTATLTYTWMNTGTQANIDQSGQVTGGEATIVLKDANGTQVYASDLRRTTGSFQSSAGASGNWRIEIKLTRTHGTVNVRVQKRS
jgi:hypothetical protein